MRIKQYYHPSRGGIADMSSEERYSGVTREQFDFCDSCGQKLPLSAMIAKCSICKGILCGNCARQYNGYWYCKAHDPTPPPEPKKSSCFIATAAYGTPFVAEIDVLRNFRDRSMEKTKFGRSLVGMYYRMSPPIADAIAVSNVRRKIVRTLLNPIVQFFKRRGY